MQVTQAPTTLQVLMLAIDYLMPDPSQPRKSFDDDEIERLAASIAARGVLMPLRVLWDAERKCWLIVTGESRWRASRFAGMTHLPCIPVEGQPDEADLLADRIIENSCRADLKPLDFARAVVKLKALKGLSSQTLAKELGITGGTLTKAESLLTLPEDIQTMVDDGRVPETAAYELSRLPDEQSQRELAHAIASGHMNRDQAADVVRGRVGKRNIKPKAGRLSCKLDGGMTVTVSSGQALNFDDLLSALDHIRKQAKKLSDEGKDVAALARALRAS